MASGLHATYARSPLFSTGPYPVVSPWALQNRWIAALHDGPKRVAAVQPPWWVASVVYVVWITSAEARHAMANCSPNTSVATGPMPLGAQPRFPQLRCTAARHAGVWLASSARQSG